MKISFRRTWRSLLPFSISISHFLISFFAFAQCVLRPFRNCCAKTFHGTHTDTHTHPDKDTDWDSYTAMPWTSAASREQPERLCTHRSPARPVADGSLSSRAPCWLRVCARRKQQLLPLVFKDARNPQSAAALGHTKSWAKAVWQMRRWRQAQRQRPGRGRRGRRPETGTKQQQRQRQQQQQQKGYEP